jgi:DNA-directed RNA polymerase specialized sigma24 family protein
MMTTKTKQLNVTLSIGGASSDSDVTASAGRRVKPHPDGVSIDDPEVFAVVDRIASDPTRPFGYLDSEDMYSEVWIICLNAIGEFRKSRGTPLEHYLRRTVKNRLINRYKEMVRPVDPPCPKCPFYEPNNPDSDCGKYGNDKDSCELWRNYRELSQRGAALAKPVPAGPERSSSRCPIDMMIKGEVVDILRSRLGPELVPVLEELADGKSLSRSDQTRLQVEAFAILSSMGYDLE